MQNENAKGQRFLVSQADTTSAKYYKNALEKAFPGIQLPDVEDSESKPVLDTKKVISDCGIFAYCKFCPTEIQCRRMFEIKTDCG